MFKVMKILIKSACIFYVLIFIIICLNNCKKIIITKKVDLFLNKYSTPTIFNNIRISINGRKIELSDYLDGNYSESLYVILSHENFNNIRLISVFDKKDKKVFFNKNQTSELIHYVIKYLEVMRLYDIKAIHHIQNSNILMVYFFDNIWLQYFFYNYNNVDYTRIKEYSTINVGEEHWYWKKVKY